MNDEIKWTMERMLSTGTACHIKANSRGVTFLCGNQKKKVRYFSALWLRDGICEGWAVQRLENATEMQLDWTSDEDVFRFSAIIGGKEIGVDCCLGQRTAEFQIVFYMELENEDTDLFEVFLYDSRQEGQPPVELVVETEYSNDRRPRVLLDLFNGIFVTMDKATREKREKK